MPTILTHVAPALAIGAGLYPRRMSLSLALAGMACAVLPDLDVVSFKLGIPYGSLFGHRGISHSFALALAVGLLAAWAAPRLRSSRLAACLLCFGAVASHIVLDAMTNGGLGVAAFWPLTEARFFLPWRPIEVAPIAPGKMFTPRGLAVVLCEIRWIWLPCLGLALGLRLAFKGRPCGRPESLPAQGRLT